MGYGLGIDLGTTFTAAAVSGDSGTRMVVLGPEVVTPSVVFVRPDGGLITGDAAEAAAAHDPMRVSRGHKRRLGDPTPLVIGGAAYSPASLLAAQLRDVVARVVAHEGGPPESIVLTCPAVWGPYRREHFDEVPRLAGLSNVRIVTEPEAAATHYAVERRLGEGELVAVYDLGGGTFDTTILRARAGGMEILGTPEGIERMGGMDFDETLMAHVDAKLDGALSALDPGDPEAAAALAAVRAQCVRAKVALSTEPTVEVRVALPAGEREVSVSRLEFNEMIRPSVVLTTEALHRTVTSAGLRPGDLAGVLLAGGSSRIPLVPQVVSTAFGRPVRVSLHPKFTVALGAAALANIARRSVAPSAPRPVGSPGEVLAQPPTHTGRTPRKTPKWLVPVGAAAVALLLTAATAVVLTSGGNEPKDPVPASTNQLSDFTLFDRADVSPYVSIIGSPANWTGTHVGADRTAAHETISVSSEDGVRVTWKGTGPGQFYLQSPGTVRDVRPHIDAKSAIVVDLTMHAPPADRTALAVHCRFPCAAEIDLTPALRKLPVGQASTVRIPLACFVEEGLDPINVDTPFLLSTAGALDVSIARVHWDLGAADEADATPCADVK
ncbi:Hsp70 family protein [Lentzea sp. E54]|uniref:Hsp70 family protein n=1 Tax=Lentzea xerophila TaxID=3435883 RepID=UPI003DA3B4B4